MNNYKTIALLLLIVFVALAGYFTGRNGNDGHNPLQAEVDSLKYYSNAKELRYENLLDSISTENRVQSKANEQTKQFVISALTQIKKTNEKFNLHYVSVPRYVDSVRANGGFR